MLEVTHAYTARDEERRRMLVRRTKGILRGGLGPGRSTRTTSGRSPTPSGRRAWGPTRVARSMSGAASAASTTSESSTGSAFADLRRGESKLDHRSHPRSGRWIIWCARSLHEPAGRRAPMRLCFLGCGRVAEAHSDASNAFARGVTLSYASRSADKAKTLASRYGGAHAFGSYREAVDNPDIDVIGSRHAASTTSNGHWLPSRRARRDPREAAGLRSDDFDQLEQSCSARAGSCTWLQNY